MDSSSDVISWVAFIMIILLSIWPYVQRNFRVLALLYKIPSPNWIQMLRYVWKIPFQRDVMDSSKRFREMLELYIDKYPVIRVGAFQLSYALLCKAESVKTILSSKNQVEKGSLYSRLRPVFGDGLVASQAPKWLQRRKLCRPSFHFKILENFLQVMNEQSNILVKILEEKRQQTNGSVFDIYPFISRCILDILCETAMGQCINAQIRHDHEYIHAVDRLWNSSMKRVISPWYPIDWIYRLTPMGRADSRSKNVITRFINEMIKNKRRELVESKNVNGFKHQLSNGVIGEKRRLAFLDLLVEESMEANGGQPLTDEDIRDEMNTLMFGGHHTSSVNISCALYYIGVNPDVQQKIVDELDQIYGDCDRLSSSSDLNNQKYLKCVIMETLRLCPPAPMIARRLTEETDICGYTIPAGTDVALWIYWVHRDPAHFPDPHAFNPDRFLPENSQDRDPFAFIPFSAGPRNCIGHRFAMMEVQVALSVILRRFKVNVLEHNQIPYDHGDLVSTPLHGIRVQLEPRSI